MPYRTIRGAKSKAPHHIYLPTLVQLPDGTYDTFPYGFTIPSGSQILERKFAPAMGGWVKADVIRRVK
jgi:hypothetical protein